MQRNLNGRVEVVFPVADARCQREVLAVLELELRDNVKARELQPDGSYLRARRAPGQRRLASQERLMERARRKG